MSRRVSNTRTIEFHRKFFLVRPSRPVSSPRPSTKYAPAHAGAVKADRLCGCHPGLGLDGFEHEGRLGRVGMTIGGSSHVAHEVIVPQPCASAAKLRGGPILRNGIEPIDLTGPRHLEPSSATRCKSRADTPRNRSAISFHGAGRRTNALGHDPIAHELPERDHRCEKLTRSRLSAPSVTHRNARPPTPSRTSSISLGRQDLSKNGSNGL